MLSYEHTERQQQVSIDLYVTLPLLLENGGEGGRLGVASGAANAFQWDQFDAPDDAAAPARSVHTLTP